MSRRWARRKGKRRSGRRVRGERVAGGPGREENEEKGKTNRKEDFHCLKKKINL